MNHDFDPTAYNMISGLEVHYQIKTDKKLFCRCPAGLYSTAHDAEILRHMRPTLSELGEYDGTALMEFKTKKEVIYLLNRESVCTYEMDDTPPFPINQEAVDIAIEIALMLNCKIVGELHIARKQYLDGSIPAGFQRTTIIGVDGWIPYKERKIRIIQLALEEDACREVTDAGHTITFRTDRLSMPLVEVVTAPDMKTPDEVAEVGHIIGDVLRTTGKVRRGIGSVRQDVNVSIEGGTRVEIKGVPRIPFFPPLVHGEAFRQHQLLKIKALLHERLENKAALQADIFDLSDVQSRIKHRLIKKSIEKRRAMVRAVALRGLKGLLMHQTQPGLTFAHEISERIRVIACLDQIPNILHTEDVSVTGFEPADIALIKKTLDLAENDAAILVWGSDRDTQTAVQEIIIRIEDAFDGVPNETRQAKLNGITDFERILPGPDRMYPDTDSPPTAITKERVESIEQRLPEKPWILFDRYAALGLASNLCRALTLHPQRSLFDRIISNGKVNPKLAAWMLVELTRALQRDKVPIDKMQNDHWIKVFDLVASRQIYREGLADLLTYLSNHPDEDPEDYLAAQHITPLTDDAVEKNVRGIAEKHRDIPLFAEENWPKVLMGLVMKEIGGCASGKAIWNLVSQQTR